MARKATKGDPQTEPAVKAGQYADVLQEMQERWQYARDRWQPIRDEGTTDMRYVSGDPWDDNDRQAREDANRPVLSFDEFGQYVNQLINEIRQHKRAIQVTPIGYGATDALAEARANLIRQIEYRSNAQQAYTTMFENTVQRSYGFLRIKAQYVNSPKASGGQGAGFDQELLIEPLPNPDLVTIDPDAMKPTGSDMAYAWIGESWSLKDYKKKWPKARVQDFDATMQQTAPSWPFDSRRIQIAEYWTIEQTPKTLLLFGVPQPNGTIRPTEVFEDDLEKPDYAALASLPPIRQRTVDVPVVKQYLTNGFEMLEPPTIWPGTTIPLIACYGKVLYVDLGSGTTRVILSLVRLARDPAMLLSYYVSCEAELIGMTPKVPYFVRRGSIKPDQLALLQKSLHEPVAVIEIEGSAQGLPAGQLPEMPSRNPYEPPIQAVEIGKEGARRAIQAAMGINGLPTVAQAKNEKSGVALREIRSQEQQGSFHFIDAYEMAITECGMKLNELVPAYYDTARDVTVRTPGDDVQQIRVNDPNIPEGQKAPIDFSIGQFDVTLSTGPSYDSEREAASDFADALSQNTQIFPLIGDLVVKLKNLGPIGDEIAKRLHAMLPPQIQQLEQAQGQKPEQLAQQLMQSQQMIQQLSQELQQASQEIQTERTKAQQAITIESMRQDGENQRAKLDYALEQLKIIADLLKTRATLEANQTEAMIDQATHELDASVALAGEREARQSVAVENDKNRQATAQEADKARAFDATRPAPPR